MCTCRGRCLYSVCTYIGVYIHCMHVHMYIHTYILYISVRARCILTGAHKYTYVTPKMDLLNTQNKHHVSVCVSICWAYLIGKLINRNL